MAGPGGNPGFFPRARPNPSDDRDPRVQTSRYETVADVLGRGAGASPAVGAPWHVPLTYDQLRTLVDTNRAWLNGRGIGRNDRMAIVLSNGPHAATAFLTVAAGATAAPLNAHYRAEEFEFYLTDVRADRKSVV